MSSAKHLPFCPNLNVLTHCSLVTLRGDIHLGLSGLLSDSTNPLLETILIIIIEILYHSPEEMLKISFLDMSFENY